MFAEDFNEKIFHYKEYDNFINDLDNDTLSRSRLFGTYFDSVENEILEDDRRFIDLVDSYTKIKENLETLIEKKCVFDKCCQLIQSKPELSQHLENNNHNNNFNNSFNNSMMEEGNNLGFEFIAGVIKAEDDIKMKRMIFRASRGTAIPTFFDFINNDYWYINRRQERDPEDISAPKIKKKIFTIFFQTGIEGFLLNKLLKICDLYGASRYNIPRRNEIEKNIQALQLEIEQLKNFLREAELSIKNFLKDKLGNEIQPGKLQLYKLYFRKEKLIHQNLNKCLIHENIIDGEVWILEKDFSKLKNLLKDFNKEESRIPTSFIDLEEANIPKPTYIQNNEFLWPFQEIVNTYGIPRYMEINPTYFNIVTFPFLFGIMFGDIGHGAVVLIIGLYLCINAENIKQNNNNDSILKNAVSARYLLLFMGFFAFYCGWIYNDFLSLPLPVFGSCYEDTIVKKVHVSKRLDKNCVYPFGFDPKWKVSTNELAFVNSFKMKFSVVVGVSHMILGIFLRGFNDIHFKNWIGFFFEFLPQFAFMTLLFGYMIFMIFIKWITEYPDIKKAPSLIAQMMNIFLKLGSVVINLNFLKH